MATLTTEMATSEEKSGIKTYLPRIIIALIVIIGGYFGYKAFVHSQHYETTDNAQIEGNSAPVLARVAGYVTAVNVDDYANVKQGQPLITIDPQEYDVALAQAEADYQQSLADLENARADVQNALAVTSPRTPALPSRTPRCRLPGATNHGRICNVTRTCTKNNR